MTAIMLPLPSVVTVNWAPVPLPEVGLTSIVILAVCPSKPDVTAYSKLTAPWALLNVPAGHSVQPLLPLPLPLPEPESEYQPLSQMSQIDEPPEVNTYPRSQPATMLASVIAMVSNRKNFVNIFAEEES